jgi:hypothetical protein
MDRDKCKLLQWQGYVGVMGLESTQRKQPKEMTEVTLILAAVNLEMRASRPGVPSGMYMPSGIRHAPSQGGGRLNLTIATKVATLANKLEIHLKRNLHPFPM